MGQSTMDSLRTIDDQALGLWIMAMDPSILATGKEIIDTVKEEWRKIIK